MKTKDIIKKLKEVDPSGETHVRFQEGELLDFIRKEGYYDGDYIYRDENDKLVVTDKGEKIDAYFEDISDIIWECEGDLEKIMSKIIIDLGSAKDYFERVIKPEAEKARKGHEKSLAEFTFRVFKKIKEGWIITQPLDTKIGHLNYMYFERNGEKEKMCQGECHAVLNSGFFKLRKENTRYIWNLEFNISFVIPSLKNA